MKTKGLQIVTAILAQMIRYFFDTRDGNMLTVDQHGLNLRDTKAPKIEAAKSWAELATDILPCSDKCELAVEVRDKRQVVLKTVLNFVAIILVS